MKRQWIVIVAGVLSLVASSSWAQGATPCAWSSLSPATQRLHTEAEFVKYPEDYKLIVCSTNTAMAPIDAKIEAQRAAIEQANAPIRSRGLVIAGLITTFAGVAMVLPQGETYHILGDAFCVDTYSVDYGSCTSLAPMYGAIALGAGITMIAIGAHHVTVSPMIGHGVKGVSGTVTWGGSHARQ